MNVMDDNEELIMEELIRIGIISNPYEIGGCGASWNKFKFFNLLKIMDHFAK